MKKTVIISILLMAIAISSCKDPLPKVIVTTNNAKAITSKSAIISGTITSSEQPGIIEFGLCWDLKANPEASGNHVSTSSIDESITHTLTDLQPETEYHVRAYAFDGEVHFYGNDVCFTTLPVGVFTVSEDNYSSTKILFSKGNLQYQASTNTWRFAEHQWDYIGSTEPDQNGYVFEGNVSGSSNHLIGPDYNGWIDLFGWGTSGHDHGAVCYQPWSTSTNDQDYYAYGDPSADLNNMWGNEADWGSNPISNGGNQSNLWRTLSCKEWLYLLNERVPICGFSYVNAIVNGVNGLILLPDDWDNSVGSLFSTSPHYTTNNISCEEWDLYEKNGAVFLPITGERNGMIVSHAYLYGCYWTSSHVVLYPYSPNCDAWQIQFDQGLIIKQHVKRHYGTAVRLVQDYNP